MGLFLYLADEIKRIYLLRLIVQHLYADTPLDTLSK